MVHNSAHDSVNFHLSKLLDQHLLRHSRDGSLQFGEAHDIAAEKMEQDNQLPPSFEQPQNTFDAFRCSFASIFSMLTLR